jgi:uncharacterized protein
VRDGDHSGNLLSERWRAAVALALLVPIPSLAVLLALEGDPGPLGRTLFVIAKLWILALPSLWHLGVDRGRVSWSPPRHGGLLTGLLLGLASSVAIVATFAAIAARIDPTALRLTTARMGIDSPAEYLAAAAYWILVNSLLEEYVWRWFAYAQLEHLLSATAAVIGTAAAFTLHHVVALQVYLPHGFVALAATGVFLGGASWSWCYRRYRSIWPGWIAHLCADVAVFAVGWALLFG